MPRDGAEHVARLHPEDVGIAIAVVVGDEQGGARVAFHDRLGGKKTGAVVAHRRNPAQYAAARARHARYNHVEIRIGVDVAEQGLGAGAGKSYGCGVLLECSRPVIAEEAQAG